MMKCDVNVQLPIKYQFQNTNIAAADILETKLDKLTNVS